MEQVLPYNIQIINWALARAGVSVQQFTEQYPEIKLLDWLENRKQPTIKQLENFSNKVHLPFGYLFLSEPPQEQLPFTFFRTNRSAKNRVDTNVYDTIQIIQRRQDWLRDYLKEVEGIKPLPFVGKFSIQTPMVEIIRDINEVLELKNDWALKFKTFTEARNSLIEKIEEAGIYVVVNGIVGNNTHRAISVEECRGFVIVDEYAPFLFVNNKDAKSAQIFTLVHELVHVWLGKSAGFDLNGLLPADDPIERLCDKVSATLLVPKTLFLEKWQRQDNVYELSRNFKVSPIVIARRALELKKIDEDTFFSFYNHYKAQFNEQNNTTESDGGDFYNTAKWRLSPRFMGYISKAVNNGDLLYKDAYRLTGLTGQTYPEFLKKKM